jgi:hypothetical protein
MRWTPDAVDALERAVAEGSRVALSRRGTEFVLIARALETEGPEEWLVGTHATTGEDLRVGLGEIEEFAVL